MNSKSTLRGTFWLMIIVQTIGGVDRPSPDKQNPRKLPSPNLFLAAVVLWGLFGLVADMSARMGRVVAAMSGTVVLGALVVGPAGSRITGFIQSIADTAAGGPGPSTAPPIPASAQPPGAAGVAQSSPTAGSVVP